MLPTQLVLFPPSGQETDPRYIGTHLRNIETYDSDERKRAQATRALLSFAELAHKVRSHRIKTNVFDQTWFQLRLARSLFMTGEIVNMPARRQAKPARKPAWKGVLTLDLTAAQLEAVDASPLDAAAVLAASDRLVQEGYKLTVAWSSYHNAAQASMTDEDNDRITGGYTLSASGDDALDAWNLLLYKHYSILDQDWSRLLNAEKPRAKRG